jgi:hypothetical protein
MERFDAMLLASTRSLLDNLGLAPAIPLDEWSRILAAGINGLATQMLVLGRAPSPEAEYSAVWLAALALTGPKA